MLGGEPVGYVCPHHARAKHGAQSGEAPLFCFCSQPSFGAGPTCAHAAGSGTAWNQPADGKGDLPSIHSKTQLPAPLPEPEQSGSVSFKDILQRMSDIEVSMEDMNSSINEILERIRGRSGPSNSESGRKASSGASSSASSTASETSDSDDDDSASTGASSATESDDESRPESPAAH